MTFKHKLSHRLARLRLSVTLLALLPVVACTEGDLGSLAPYESMTLAGKRDFSISPKSVVVESGKAINFKSSSDNPEAVKWTSSGGTISSDGAFTSSTEGDFLIVSRVSLSGGEKTDTARVRVVRQQPGRDLTVSPRSAELLPGQSVHFTVTATLSDGSTTEAKVNWKVSGGEVDQQDNYIAGQVPGTYPLVAFIPSAGVADTVLVTIKPSTRRVVRLLLAPATAAVVTGGVVMYAATAQYEDGGTEPAWAEFSATGGTISPNGQEATYTAPNTTGTYTVTAKTPDGTMTATGSVSVESSGGTKDSVVATPTEPGPSPSPTPSLTQGNEPAGYTRFAEMRGGTLVTSPVCATLTTAAGCWWKYGGGLSILSDPNAPSGTTEVLQMTFPTGLEPGYSRNLFGGWQTSPGEYREVYESGYFKIPSADFETQKVGVKLWGYWGIGGKTTSDNPVQLYMVLKGNGLETAVMSSWNIWFGQQGTDARAMYQNVNQAKVRANTWHQYEVLMKVNDLGVRNGVLKVWLDGTLILSYSDVLWRTSTNPIGFFGRKWDPVWGGQGGSAKSRNDYLWVNRVYMSGIPN